MADLGVLSNIVITRLYGHLWSGSLQQNFVLCLHFKCILIRRWWHLRQGVFEARIVGLLFWAFSLGPPLAKSQKMADLGVLANIVITRLYGHLWSGSLQQNVVLCLHFKCILIRKWWHLRRGVFEAPIVGLLFWAFSLGPPLAKSQKMADLGVLANIVITRLYRHLWSGSLQQNVVLCLHFKCILIRRWWHLRQGVFEARIIGLHFWAFSLVLGPPLTKSQKMADLDVLANIVITRVYGHLWSGSLQQNVVLCLYFKCILIKRWWHLRQGVWSPYSRPTFLSIFIWSPLGKISENGRFRCPCQHCHNSAIRTLMERSLQQNVVLCLHFKCMLMRRWWHLPQGVFEARIVGLLFWAFFLGPPLAKSQKMADLGVLANIVITRLYGHLWSGSLQQNVVLCLHFKCILIRRWWHLRQGVFEAPIVGLLFWAFSLGPPLAKSQKMADLGVLANIVITRLFGHLWSGSLQQNVVLCLHFKCILIRRWWHLRQGVFEAPIVGLLF